MLLNIINRFSTSTTSSFSDIIICGGGMVGTTMACALAKMPCLSDKSITLIEAFPQQNFVPSKSYSNRVSAISPFSKNLLERLGIWKNIKRYQEVHNMKIWGLYPESLLNIDNKENGKVAYIVENSDIIQAVTNEIQTVSNLRVLYKKNVSTVNLQNSPLSLPQIILDDGSEHQCSLLIGADGVNSKVRKAMDINYLTWDYNQMGVVATLEMSERESNNTAWQRFLPEGPIALLPLSNNFSSLVWSTTKTNARNLLNMPNENFVEAVNTSLSKQYNTSDVVKAANETVHTILNTIGLPKTKKTLEQPPNIIDIVNGSRAAFPLGFGHSVQYATSNVILIGDAAHRVHPLAGQGVNLGFQDVDSLVKVLSDAVRNGREIGDIEDLTKYESFCQQNNVPVMTFIELIHRIYTSERGAIQALGDICLQIANAYDPVKTQINKRALFSRSN
uniref:Ubiquinone biosynthesis monooxygenase COQ6, mitochondrial n=1 Tax=Rhodnius prolixus TaxID=13249 RepID=R4FK38_RHOPR